MIFGDFNAIHRSWNGAKNNKSITHHPHLRQTPSTIDILHANVSLLFDISACAGHLSSDHDPVVCEIDEILRQSTPKNYNSKNADWILIAQLKRIPTKSLNARSTISFDTNGELIQKISKHANSISRFQIDDVTNLIKALRPYKAPGLNTKNIVKKSATSMYDADQKKHKKTKSVIWWFLINFPTNSKSSQIKITSRNFYNC